MFQQRWMGAVTIGLTVLVARPVAGAAGPPQATASGQSAGVVASGQRSGGVATTQVPVTATRVEHRTEIRPRTVEVVRTQTEQVPVTEARIEYRTEYRTETVPVSARFTRS